MHSCWLSFDEPAARFLSVQAAQVFLRVNRLRHHVETMQRHLSVSENGCLKSAICIPKSRFHMTRLLKVSRHTRKCSFSVKEMYVNSPISAKTAAACTLLPESLTRFVTLGKTIAVCYHHLLSSIDRICYHQLIGLKSRSQLRRASIWCACPFWIYLTRKSVRVHLPSIHCLYQRGVTCAE